MQAPHTTAYTNFKVQTTMQPPLQQQPIMQASHTAALEDNQEQQNF